MNTEKGRKKTITILGLVGILVITTWLLVPVTQAVAETVKKAKVTSYVIKTEAIPFPDVKGHIVGVLERRGLAVFEDGEVAAYHAQLRFDLIIQQGGDFQGYSQLTFKDGSTTIAKVQGTQTLTPGEKLPTVAGKSEYIKGTGRFQGIKGNVSFTGKSITPYGKETKGDMVVDLTSTYTLPSK